MAESSPVDSSLWAWVRRNQEKLLNDATSLYPLYVTVGSVVAYLRPETFLWFVQRGPTSYSLALGLIMLAMGLTLRIQDLRDVIWQRSAVVAFGCGAQYTIMPLMGLAASRMLSLPQDMAAGLVLLACCPGGTASNVVTYIADGDVPLSIIMTVCTTLSAVVVTPFLTKAIAGTFVPVDAAALAISTLQVVLLPVLLGAWLQSSFPRAVAQVTPFSPVAAVLTSSLLACSVFSTNVSLFASSGPSAAGLASMDLLLRVLAGVLLVHTAGFTLGYVISSLVRLDESQRRAISIEVGMQNSSLAVVLATKHFSSPLAAVPGALSAVLMNVMGSGLAVLWRKLSPLTPHLEAELVDEGKETELVDESKESAAL